MKTKSKKQTYRICPYCKRYIPINYNFSEHKKMCKNVGIGWRGTPDDK